MEPLFIARLAASFLTAAAVVTLAGVAAERLGPRAGGLLAALPSLVVVAYFFIHLQEGGAFVFQASQAFPSVMAANVLFLAAFALLAPRGLAPSFGGSLLIWAAAILVLERTAIAEAFHLGFAAYAGATLIAIVGFAATQRHATAAADAPALPTTLRLQLLRGGLAGAVAATALVLSRIAGPVVGGLASGLPVIFASTMLFTHRGLGPLACRRIGGAMVGGAFTPVAFAFIAGRLHAVWGPGAAMLGALALTAPVAWAVVAVNRWGARRLDAPVERTLAPEAFQKS